MSLGVAIQSAVFYVVACTPCTTSRQRGKAKAKAKRERLEKDRLEAENPGLYRQPSPFNTSPHWEEEIMMGPSLPKKSRNNNNSNTSQRRLTTSSSSGRETVVSSSTLAVGLAPIPGMVHTPSTKLVPHPGSSSTVAPDDVGSIAGGGSESWNLKLYQREDEELWGDQNSSIYQGRDGDVGRTGHNKIMDAIVKAGSSAGRLLDSTLLGGSGKERGAETREVTNEDRRNFYAPSSPTRSSSSSDGSYAPVKNPPVNDYHPPVVSSRPAHRDGRKWMLQPPPPVKVMEAKVPVSRSASMASTVSRRSAISPSGASVSDIHLGRVVGERLVGAKIKGGELPFPGAAATADSRVGSSGSLGLPKTRRPRRATASSSRSKLSQHSEKSKGMSSDSDDGDFSDRGRPSLSASPRKSTGNVKKSPAARRQAAVATSEDESGAISEGHGPHAAQRPRLETIVSSDRASPVEPPEAAKGVKADDVPVRPAGASMDSGLALSLA
ncbi:hypothetical protein MAPG_03091 [Magnaporthiopsis poae ATCC 64411]|uniref:Signal peptide-containing protein n=1 Tax=Magnaporthiopsis poae (strain ATCC 64411 / 73-15) TaxID=644358 RepID=A0A0C4DT36_MAGP6|nr:hypothetical protein MAPG_03091 [Magnaporthiopsis poae ATCC 64411]